MVSGSGTPRTILQARLKAGTRTRTSTRAGRDGTANERKSRTAPAWKQYGQPIGSSGASGLIPSRTGASQRGQASVPGPSREERQSTRFS